jgi:hypothetical protein
MRGWFHESCQRGEKQSKERECHGNALACTGVWKVKPTAEYLRHRFKIRTKEKCTRDAVRGCIQSRSELVCWHIGRQPAARLHSSLRSASSLKTKKPSEKLGNDGLGTFVIPYLVTPTGLEQPQDSQRNQTGCVDCPPPVPPSLPLDDPKVAELMSLWQTLDDDAQRGLLAMARGLAQAVIEGSR